MWDDAPFEVSLPSAQRVPLVVSSPHSGRRYPEHFLAASQLSPQELRRSEDSYVDRLVALAPSYGAPLIAANFPRASVDVNREPYELDGQLIREALPDYANSRTPRVAAGLGTVARVVANGREIYEGRIPLADVLSRIERCYIPYHRTLRQLIDETCEIFGYCLLLDVHSMPALPSDGSNKPINVVLGDCHGSSTSIEPLTMAERSLRSMGYNTAINTPYAGGFITRHYGRPAQGVHALQIELARDLYMDEENLTPSDGIRKLTRDMSEVIGRLAQWRCDAVPLPRAAE